MGTYGSLTLASPITRGGGCNTTVGCGQMALNLETRELGDGEIGAWQENTRGRTLHTPPPPHLPALFDLTREGWGFECGGGCCRCGCAYDAVIVPKSSAASLQSYSNPGHPFGRDRSRVCL